MGLLASDAAAAMFAFGLGSAVFLICVTSFGRSKSGTVAAQRGVRTIAMSVVAIAICIGGVALVEAKLGDRAAAWGAGTAAIGSLLIGLSVVLSRSYELRHQNARKPPGH